MDTTNILHAPKAVTLFSGVGGSSLALRNLGYWVMPHDFMPEAVDSLKANGFSLALEADVRDIDWSLPRYANTKVLEGGPPCQPFSQSHDGDGQYDPRDMIPEFLRAIDGLLPELFVMEEVQTLTWKAHRAYFEMVLDHMRTLGYVVEWRVLDASKMGLAQKRKRLIVVGVRQDIADHRAAYGVPAIVFPTQAAEPRTMADCLGWDAGDAYEANLQTPAPGGDYSWVFERPSVTVVGSFRPDVMAKPGYRKAGDPPRQSTPGSVSCTQVERLLLQDFPADWKVCGAEAKRDLQIGNSVPVGLMQAVVDLNK